MLTCQKKHFNLDPDITYINCAYMGPMPILAYNAAHKGLSMKLSPDGIRRNDFFEPLSRVKKAFNDLISGDNQERVAYIPSVSYGMSNVAFNAKVRAGENVVIMDEQFPSNYYIWDRICTEKNGNLRVAKYDSFQQKTFQLNQSILDLIDEQTNTICLAHVHWADGTLIDLSAIIKKARKFGAKVVVDGTQSIGAMPFSLADFPVDALICAAYKWMFGPYGSGLAYYGPAFDDGLPIEENWINRKHSDQFENLVDYQNQYRPFAGRFNMGEQSNFISLPSLEVSLGLINSWSVSAIQDYCKTIQMEAISKLRGAGFFIPDDQQRAFHLFGIEIPGEYDVTILLKHLKDHKIYLSRRGDVLRVSPNVYNEHKDFHFLADVMIDFIS